MNNKQGHMNNKQGHMINKQGLKEKLSIKKPKILQFEKSL